MDPLLGRIEIVEQHVQNLTQQVTSSARRFRWWHLACTLMVLTIFSLPISLGADDRRHDDRKGDHRGHFKSKHDDNDDKELRKLRDRIRALERKLQHVTRELDENGLPEVVITGANLRIVNGLGRTDCIGGQSFPDCPNGLGNLIVGYNEPRDQELGINNRTGSHNIVVGQRNNFSRNGGLVVGDLNEISGDFASVSGGRRNTAGGFAASVSGGQANTAGGFVTSVSGGDGNQALFESASISGGFQNLAFGEASSISGGRGNSVGFGFAGTVSGGANRVADGDSDWVAGTLFQDE
jgi:hypothetical protein